MENNFKYIPSGGYAWSANSDRRLKTNIEGLEDKDGLSAILKLRPVTYNWIDRNATHDKQYGFIAQEVQKVLPGPVTTGKDITITKLDGSKEELKDVKADTDAKTAKLEADKAEKENVAMKARLDKIEKILLKK